ncbi:hypothetical protein Rhe02_54120 [Rhizocola hellebori]|uniref:HTH cro/C1-type domain-containing protein n=1 Tax=Rhizocola hellebori TaxID=1392758 RepID=A0A8J3VI88_9ACTN|nr:helix-turn-helix transcriptional regulator [Rhizocola hellebori]GIH07345.1 hypothetical protein Rhe02_54120 [Rhizocola hellebori]
MRQSTTEYVAAEVRAELGRQGHDNNTWLAAQLDVSEMWVSRRLRCVTEFSADDLVRVARVLGVPVSQFLPDTAPARVA